MACLKSFVSNTNKLSPNSLILIFSQSITNDIVEQVVEGHAIDILAMKDKVEHMWSTSNSKRSRWTLAASTTPGFCLFGDNVGMMS